LTVVSIDNPTEQCHYKKNKPSEQSETVAEQSRFDGGSSFLLNKVIDTLDSHRNDTQTVQPARHARRE
jgi:hypothetical protein